MEIVKIVKEAVERVGRNQMGFNLYKYRWVVYEKDNRKEPYGLSMIIKGEEIKVKRAFIGTKKEVDNFVKENTIDAVKE